MSAVTLLDETHTTAYWKAEFPDLWNDPGRTYGWGVLDVLLGEAQGLDDSHIRRNDGIWIAQIKANEAGAGPFGLGWVPESLHVRQIHPTGNHDEPALPVPCTLEQFALFERVRGIFLPQFVADNAMTRLIVPKLIHLGRRAPRALELVLSAFFAEIPKQAAMQETTEERCARLLMWFEEERGKGYRGALARVAKRDGRARQTVSADVKRAEQKTKSPFRIAQLVRR